MTRFSKSLIALIFAVLAISVHAPAMAQVPVGRCVDQMRAQSFTMLSNYYVYQDQLPANSGTAVRDPSGMTYLRMPAAQPWVQAFFVDWSGRLVEINRNGWFPIGYCQFDPGFVTSNPYQDIYRQPVMSRYGVEGPNNGFLPIPQQIVRPDEPFGIPMVASQSQAMNCYQTSSGNRTAFGDCMVRAMAGERERAAYNCARGGGGSEAVSICLVGALGGQRERQVAQALSDCRQQYGSNYNQYPLCLARGQVGGDAGKVLACVQQQTQQGQVTFMGTAMCYGASSLNLNPEMQIVAQCAVASGGEPYSFAGCAGGQLTTRELNKCFTHGVGGSQGCFGPNNTIVQAFSGVGNYLGQQFGPNNDIVRTWNTAVNDLQHGPGPNHEVVRTFRNIGNEAGRAGENIKREVGKVLPKIRIRL